VHRNTVLAAFAELTQEGWIVTRPARGTFVADALPDVTPRRFGLVSRPRKHVELPLAEPWPAEPYEPLPEGVLPLIGGWPDLRLLPVSAIASAYRSALRLAPRTLGYGSERGHPRLRAALATMLNETRGLRATADDVLVTRGSQMAFFLAARALVSPGDVIAVEAFGYRPGWEAMRLGGARLVPIAVDGGGIRIDALEAACGEHRVRAVYVTPHHQYPTTVTLTPGRRLALLALAARERFIVIEDDYDHEFHYTGRPILPLGSADEAGVVVYVGTLSKVFFPGLRMGYVVARPEIVERMRRIRYYIDRQGDLSVEWAVATLIEEGELARHTRRVRRHYAERRNALVEALRSELGDVLSFHEPPGGMALWARVRNQGSRRADVEAWTERALARRVVVHSARRFDFEGRSRPFLRLGYAALTPTEIRGAVRALAQAWKR
jgi:GntR family transcriptional regulator/MocR family aminotransferase